MTTEEQKAIRRLVGLGSEIAGLEEKRARWTLELSHLLNSEPPSPLKWFLPVGSTEYPPEMWYIANRHSLDGVGNGGRIHSGVDWNVQVWPRGDVDYLQPLWCVTRSTVYAVAYSQNYLGSVVLKTEENGEDLYIRYWHLANNDTFRALAVGQVIEGGVCLGNIGNYKLGAGGDHAHWDTARSPFDVHWWLTRHPKVLWCDPIPILKRHFDPVVIDAMMSTATPS